MASGGLNLDPSIFFIPSVRPGLRGPPLKFCRVLVDVYEEIRTENIGTGSPLLLYTPPPPIPSCANLTRRGGTVPRFSVLLFHLLPTPNYTIPFYVTLIYAFPTTNSLACDILLTLKLFCIVLPYLYVAFKVLCGFARPSNLAAMFFCAPAQKHKIGNTGTHSGFFGPMNLRKEKKLSTFMN